MFKILKEGSFQPRVLCSFKPSINPQVPGRDKDIFEPGKISINLPVENLS